MGNSSSAKDGQHLLRFNGSSGSSSSSKPPTDYCSAETEDNEDGGKRKGWLTSSLKAVKNKILLFLILSGVCLGNMERTQLAPVYPPFAVHVMNQTEISIGLVVASSSVSTFASCFLWASLLPVMGAQSTFVIGIIGTGIFSIVFSLLPWVTFPHAFLALSILLRVIIGVFTAASFISELSILAGVFPKHAGAIGGYFLASAYLGKMLGPLLGGTLYEVLGFTAPYIVTAVCMIVLGFSAMCVIPSSLKITAEAGKGSCKTYLKMLKIPNFTMCALLVGIHFAITGMNISFLTLKLEDWELSPIHTGLIFCAYAALYMLASFIAGLLDVSKHEYWPIIYVVVSFFLGGLSLTLQGPAPFYYIEDPSLWLLIVTFCLQSVFAFGVVPAMSLMFSSVQILELPEVERNGIVSGIIWGFATCGQALGAVFGGIMYQELGWAWVVTGFGITIWICVAVFIGVVVVQYITKDYYFDIAESTSDESSDSDIY